MIKRVKVVFAGQSAVGKSSIIYRFDHDRIPDGSSTVGASFMYKRILHNGENINIDI